MKIENNGMKEQESGSVQVIEENDTKEETVKIKTLEKSKEEEQTTLEEHKKSKLEKVWIIVTIILLIIAMFSTIFAVMNSRNNKMIKGIKIDQIDVSKMTKEDVRNVLEDIYSKKAENEIYFVYGEFESITTYTALEVQFQIDEAIKKAYEVGRKGNLFIDNFEILTTWIKGKEIELSVVIDEEMINQVVQNINNSIEGAIVQPSYYIEDGKLIITSGKEGLKVDEAKLTEEIYKVVKNETQKIEIPLINAMPDVIDIEKIHQEVYKEVQNAYYTKEPFTIYPEADGIDFDVENAKLILAEQRDEYEIPLIITKPTKTTREIGSEAFPDLLATFSTKYQASNTNRTTNMRLAANKINGTVLLAGEEFSYNKTVGKRTAAAGFKMATIYSGGKIVDGIGGGICQISTTLYDAVVMANLDITERRNHQFLTSYVPGGKDATVSWGTQDFKFKNTRNYPIRITATLQGGVATVQIWGLKEDVEYDITIESKKTATIAYTTQYIQDPNLPAGQEQVVQEGKNGSKYEAYKVTKLNGEVISRTLLSKDTYNPMKKIINIGIGQ